MNMLAKIISKLFEPMITLFVVALLGGWQAGLTGPALVAYLSYITVLFSIVAWARAAIAKRYKTDWDISERAKRIRPLVLLLGFAVFNVFMVFFWKNPALTHLYLLLSVWLAGFFLLTLFIKISGHVGIVTLALGLIIRWFGWTWWPVALTIPLVGWARVAGRHHTVLEVIAGILYSWAVLQFVTLV